MLEKEADFILDYIEKFNDLLEKQKYIEAAYMAAAGPKNILRNLETFQRFKCKNWRQIGSWIGGIKFLNFSLDEAIREEYGYQMNEEEDPLLAYCIAIVDTKCDKFSKPSKELSLECIKVILEYNKIDILSRWVSQKK